jgi:serine/threonine protein kinase
MSWSDLIGRELDEYKIIAELGRGGSSRVYRASDPRNNREVAIKVIPNDVEDRVGFVRRFQREVQAVEQLSHPHIVAVYDKGENDDLVYLVMQCVNGGTLRQRLGKPLPVYEAAALTTQMAGALHHAHLRGIIHRDVKPSNMLVDEIDSSKVLLTDFGIAKLQGTRGMTKSGTTVGTPEYMAPEQAEGKEIDQRADVYALGCVLYEMLTGRPPFTGATPVSVLYQQVHARPAYIRGFNPEVPRELAKIIDIALAKRPNERFGTAETFAEALAPFKQPGGTQADDGMKALRVMNVPPSGQSDRPASGIPLVSGMPDQEPAYGASYLAPLASTPQPEQVPVPNPEVKGETPPANSPPQDTEQTPTEQPPSARKLADPLRQTIPLPAFRLPARPTRPLDKPFTLGDYGQGYMPPAPAPQQPATDRSARDVQDQPTIETWKLPSQQPPAGPAPHSPPLPPLDTAYPFDQPTGLRRALREPPQPIWRPDLPEDLPPRRRRSKMPLVVGVIIAAVLLLSVAGWMVVSASGLGASLGKTSPQATPHPTARATVPAATATPVPTVTPTVAPTATPTATANIQKQLDAIAAASFRSVTLGTFHDSSCQSQNATQRFSAGQTVYVNLCTSASMSNAPVTIQIRHAGQVWYTLLRNQQLAPGSAYWYSRYAVPAGSYDMLVSMTIQGRQAVARDISFTVG